jgi:hypothetical protein
MRPVEAAGPSLARLRLFHVEHFYLLKYDCILNKFNTFIWISTGKVTLVGNLLMPFWIKIYGNWKKYGEKMNWTKRLQFVFRD